MGFCKWTDTTDEKIPSETPDGKMLLLFGDDEVYVWQRGLCVDGVTHWMFTDKPVLKPRWKTPEDQDAVGRPACRVSYSALGGWSEGYTLVAVMPKAAHGNLYRFVVMDKDGMVDRFPYCQIVDTPAVANSAEPEPEKVKRRHWTACIEKDDAFRHFEAWVASNVTACSGEHLPVAKLSESYNLYRIDCGLDLVGTPWCTRRLNMIIPGNRQMGVDGHWSHVGLKLVGPATPKAESA